MTKSECKSCVGKGWGKLIDKLFTILKPSQVYYFKEKYGRMSIFPINISDELLDKVIKIEKESEKTCELCGEKGKIREKKGWFTCLCNKCFNIKK